MMKLPTQGTLGDGTDGASPENTLRVSQNRRSHSDKNSGYSLAKIYPADTHYECLNHLSAKRR
jgi:hypothetical protein